MGGRSEKAYFIMFSIYRNFAFVHEIHADEGVNLKVVDEGDGVGNISMRNFNRERIGPCRTERESVCPAEAWLRGNLSGMGMCP